MKLNCLESERFYYYVRTDDWQEICRGSAKIGLIIIRDRVESREHHHPLIVG